MDNKTIKTMVRSGKKSCKTKRKTVSGEPSVSSKSSKSASLTPSQLSDLDKRSEISKFTGMGVLPIDDPCHVGVEVTPASTKSSNATTRDRDIGTIGNDDDQAKAEPDTSISAETPTSVSWMTMASTQQSNQAAVEAFVSRDLFPVVKFVTNRDYALRFDIDNKSICGFVLNGLNIPLDVNREDWWQQMKTCVANTLSGLRNNKNTSMKWACFGELFICVQISYLKSLITNLNW